MAITKTFARAPCPIFAGRGVDNEGFTIKMPYKTYLTCEKANIASERSLLTVFNYDLAEYVYNQTADAYAFGVYVETGAYTDAITDAKHMYAAKFFLKLSEAYSLGAGERQNADVRAVSIGLEVAYDLSGVAHGVYISAQFKEDADGVTIGGYYLANTQTYGVIGLEVRTEAKDNGDGGITVGAAAFGCVGILVAQKNDAAWTGNYAAIALHIPYEGSDAIVGTTYGIRFDDAGLWTGTALDYGIYFNTGTVVTNAIAVASTCVSAIAITGECSGPAITVTAECDQVLYGVYNIDSALGTWIHGVKIELTRTGDVEIASGAFYGAQIVINKGAQATALAPNIYALQVVVKGAATGGNCYGLQVETQSSGEVDYLTHIRLNTGTTLASGGAMLYLQTYVTTAKGIKFATGAAITVTDLMYFEDNAEQGTVTNVISTDLGSASFFLRSVNSDCGYLAGVTTHDTESDEIKVQIGSTTKYIKLYT